MSPKRLPAGSNNLVKSRSTSTVETGYLHLGIVLSSIPRLTKYILFSSPSQIPFPGFLISVNITYPHVPWNLIDKPMVSDSLSLLSRRNFTLNPKLISKMPPRTHFHSNSPCLCWVDRISCLHYFSGLLMAFLFPVSPHNYHHLS